VGDVIDDPLLLPIAQAMLACYAADAVPAWQNNDRTCHLFRAEVGDATALLFEGTLPDAEEWLEDLDPTEETVPDVGPVHRTSLRHAREALPFALDAVRALPPGRPFVLGGHSKGAREAPLLGALLRPYGLTPLGTYLFEPPRVGGPRLYSYLLRDYVVATQTHNGCGDDIFTHLPAGFGWTPCYRADHLVRLRVPDALGVRDKHIMSGVVAGLRGDPTC